MLCLDRACIHTMMHKAGVKTVATLHRFRGWHETCHIESSPLVLVPLCWVGLRDEQLFANRLRNTCQDHGDGTLPIILTTAPNDWILTAPLLIAAMCSGVRFNLSSAFGSHLYFNRTCHKISTLSPLSLITTTKYRTYSCKQRTFTIPCCLLNAASKSGV